MPIRSNGRSDRIDDDEFSACVRSLACINLITICAHVIALILCFNFVRTPLHVSGERTVRVLKFVAACFVCARSVGVGVGYSVRFVRRGEHLCGSEIWAACTT